LRIYDNLVYLLCSIRINYKLSTNWILWTLTPLKLEMTRIDFYIVDSNTPLIRENFACKLIEKVQQQGHNIVVTSTSTQHAKLLDDLLWSFKPESFVPHALSDSTIAQECSVVIGTENTITHENRENDVLVNFNTDVPKSFSQYSRVVEIVNKQDNSSTEGRIRYSYYKDRGYKMESHNIRG